MLPEKETNDLERLAISYFTGELGIPSEGVGDAAQNLLGVFDVLLRIDERLKCRAPPSALTQ
jgi:hypothetical protein